ncbi:MAG: PEP-CTERM sorting domain-containing protein [Chthoniobacterales bacterium]
MSIIVAGFVRADVVYNGVAAGHSLSMSTDSSRTASAIDSVVWNGVEFIDSYDHGRQLQSAVNHGISGYAWVPESYNPTQAGSVSNGRGEGSTSTLISENVSGNQLTTSGAMAFWLPASRANSYNDVNLSATTIDTTYTFGASLSGIWFDNIIRHDVTFHVPATPQVDDLGATYFYHQFEALTGYMPPEFNTFRTWNPATNQLTIITAPDMEQNLPLIVSTADGQYAMGIFSYDLPQDEFLSAGYGAWFFEGANSDAGSGAGVSKWNAVYRIGRAELTANVFSGGDYSFTLYVVVGTVADVQNSFNALHNVPEPSSIILFGFSLLIFLKNYLNSNSRFSSR